MMFLGLNSSFAIYELWDLSKLFFPEAQFLNWSHSVIHLSNHSQMVVVFLSNYYVPEVITPLLGIV